MLGYNGGLDGLAISRNVKCIRYLAFILPYSHQLLVNVCNCCLNYVESPHTLGENFQSRLVVYCDIIYSTI